MAAVAYQPRYPLKSHQIEALDAARGQDVFAYLMRPGTGKTVVSLAEFGALVTAGEVDTALVIAPNGVHHQWVDEAARHCTLRGLRSAAWVAGTKNKALEQTLSDPSRPALVAFNTETVQHKNGVETLRRILRSRRCYLVVDEAHNFRTPGAARTRQLWKLAELAPVRRILTGTPSARGYENLYAQFRILDWRILQQRTYAGFRASYCQEEGPYRTIRGYHHVPELFRLMAPYSYIADKSSDLPAQDWLERWVEFLPEQRRIYHQLRDEFLAELPSGEMVPVPLAITRIQKLQQVAAGHVSLGEGRWEAVPTAKLAATADLVEAAERKCLIWCQWQPDVEQLLETLKKAGIPALPYYGALSDTEAQANLRRFREESHWRAFVATAAKGGTGLNLNEAPTAIYYSNSLRYDHREQSEARNHREGQTEPVLYYDVLVRGSRDAWVRGLLRSRERLADQLMTPDTFRRILVGD